MREKRGRFFTMARVNKEYREGARERIVSAAIDIAAEKGWEAMTLDAIAQAIGVTTPALYSYFKNRDALQDEVVLRAIRINQENLKTVVSQDKNIRQIFRDYADQAFIRQTRYSAILSNLPLRFLEDPEKRQELARFFKDYSAIVRDSLARAQEKGEIPPRVDLDHATRLINALPIGLKVSSIFLDKLDPASEKELWIEAVERILLLD